jgi:POT family proton-dependent oligopeptide transporter
MTANVASQKHPKGLYFLFFTEMWERFGYYLMLGIFVLYMTDVDKGGLAINDRNADDIFGTFIALTYLTPFLGGFLADRLLGYVRAVYIGGTLMGLGYLGIALPGMVSFYVSITLIIVGNGFFKPSISTLLGNLYNTEEYKSKKDAGYNIFYMGINIGAFICNIIAAFMRNKWGWDAAFISAGVGMFLGLIIFSFGLKHIRSANVLKPASANDMSIGGVLMYVFVPALITGAIGWIIPGTIFGSDTTDAFIFAVIPVIIFYVSLYFKANKEDKRPIAALLAIFAVSIMFWAVFKQNGTALTRWAKYYTDRELSAVIEQPAKQLYLAEEISSEITTVTKYDDQFRAVKEEGKVLKEEGRDPYFKNMPAEEIPQNGEKVYLMNTELFQSVNPFWVVALTPVVVAFFALLRRRKREPSTPSKIAWGLFISALSTLVMVGAVYAGSNGAIKVSPLWLVGSYGVITVGELFLSPMGLSLVSKLSPPRLTALMMGGFFLSTSIGNKLSGVLSVMWYNYENKANFFLVNCLLLLIAASVAFILLRWLNQVMKEKNLS